MKLGFDVIPVLALGISLLSLWLTYSRGKPKLKIRTRIMSGHYTIAPGSLEDGIPWDGVVTEIVNTGDIDVTIDQFGFEIAGTDSRCVPLTSDSPLPAVVKARQPYQAAMSGREGERIFARKSPELTRAFVRTACGHIFKGSKRDVKLLKQIASRRENLRLAQNENP